MSFLSYIFPRMMWAYIGYNNDTYHTSNKTSPVMLSWKVAISFTLHDLQYRFSSYDISICGAVRIVTDAAGGWCDLTHLPLVPHMRQWNWSAFVQIMACRLFGAKLLFKPMQGYCQLDHQDHCQRCVSNYRHMNLLTQATHSLLGNPWHTLDP